MAYTAWAASTAYVVGDIVRASALQASGLVFQCTTAGTSAATEPAWATDIGSTTADNTVTWTAISSVYEELAGLAPSAIIELFELHLDTTLHGSSDVYRWHNGVNANVTGNITWNGNPYVRLPIQADGFDFTNSGSLPRPTLTVANLSGTITTLLLLVNATTPGNDLGGAMVKRIRTLKKYLDGEAAADPHAKFPDEIWYVDRKANETRDAVSFELASKFDLAGVMLPKRQVIANICQWKYRSTECSYIPKAAMNATYSLKALSGTYSQSGTTLTITSAAHGIAAGDNLYLSRTQTASGTYSQTGTVLNPSTTLTISATAHGFSAGETVALTFTSGSPPANGNYTIASASTNSFTITTAAFTSSRSGNVNVSAIAPITGYCTVATSSTNTFTITVNTSNTQSGTYNLTWLKISYTAHGLIAQENVYLLFTTGSGSSGPYKVSSVSANAFTVEVITGSTTTGNVTVTQWFDVNDNPVTVSTADVCGKRLGSCEARFGAGSSLPFGSYPSAGLF